jgi:hypothetical protein
MDFRRSGNSTTNSTSIRRRPSGDSVKRWCVLILHIAVICTSILTISSCKFFSYKEIAVYNDTNTTSITTATTSSTSTSSTSTSTSTIEESWESVASYEPFEYLPKAGVGLFKYYMGDPSGKGAMMNDRMCFYYSDEFTDYGYVDTWLLARYCSILAPIAGLLALFQTLLEIICGYNIMSQCGGNGKFLKTQLLLIATFLQVGTFSVLFATPIMYSTSAEDQKQQFCFSTTSKVRCKMDSGSVFSLISLVIYVVLAFLSFFARWYPSTNGWDTSTTKDDTKGDIERDTDEESDPEVDTIVRYIKRDCPESESENENKNTQRDIEQSIMRYILGDNTSSSNDSKQQLETTDESASESDSVEHDIEQSIIRYIMGDNTNDNTLESENNDTNNIKRDIDFYNNISRYIKNDDTTTDDSKQENGNRQWQNGNNNRREKNIGDVYATDGASISDMTTDDGASISDMTTDDQSISLNTL